MPSDNTVTALLRVIDESFSSGFKQAHETVKSFGAGVVAVTTVVRDTLVTTASVVYLASSAWHVLEGAYASTIGAAERLTEHVTEQAHQLVAQSESLAISVGGLESLRMGMDVFGLGAQSATMTLRMLARNLEAVAGGARLTAKDAFRELGISVDYLKEHGKDTDAVLETVVRHLAAMPSTTHTVALAQAALGRQGQQLVAVYRELASTGFKSLKDFGEAMGYIVPPEVEERLAKVQVQFNILGKQWEALKEVAPIAIAENLLSILKLFPPALAAVVKGFRAWAEQGTQTADELKERFLDWVTSQQEGFKRAAAALAAFYGLAREAFFGVGELLASTIEWLVKLHLEFEKLELWMVTHSRTVSLLLMLLGGLATETGHVGIATAMVGASYEALSAGATTSTTALEAHIRSLSRETKEAQTVAEGFRKGLESLDSVIPTMDGVKAAAERAAEELRLGLIAAGKPIPAHGITPESEPAAATKPKAEAEQKAAIAAEAKKAEAQLAIAESTNKSRLALGLITSEQEVRQEMVLADRRFEIQKHQLEQERGIADIKPAEKGKLDAQIEALELTHQAKMIDLQTRLTETQNKDTKAQIERATKARTDILDLQTKQVEAQRALGELTASEALRIERELITQKFDAEREATEKIRGLQGTSLEEYKNLTAKIIESDNKKTGALLDNLTKLKEETRKEAEEARAYREKMGRSILSPFQEGIDQLVQGWIEGTQKMSDIWRKFLVSMAIKQAEAGIGGVLLGGEKGTITGGVFGGGIAGILGEGLGKVVPALGPEKKGEPAPSLVWSLFSGLFGKKEGETPGKPQTEVKLFTADTFVAKSMPGVLGKPPTPGAPEAPGVKPTYTPGQGMPPYATPTPAPAAMPTYTPGQGMPPYATPSGGGISSELSKSFGPGGDAMKGFGQALDTSSNLVGMFGHLSDMKEKSGLQLAQMVLQSGYQALMLIWDALNYMKPSLLGFTYQSGGIVPTAGPAMLHPKEMVLPAHLATGLQDLITTGAVGAQSLDLSALGVRPRELTLPATAPVGSVGRGGEGGVTAIHISPQINLQTTDNKSFEGRLQEHSETIARVIVGSLRGGHPALRAALGKAVLG